MRTSHLLGLVAAAAFALLAPNASAFTNVTVGDPVTFQLASSTFSLGSFSSCTGSTMNATVTQDAGPGAGGALDIHTASFSGCQVWASTTTFTPDTSTPWPVTMNAAGQMTIQNFNFTERWGFRTCHYSGDITGQYDQNSGNMTISGNVTRRSGSSLCPLEASVHGTYRIRSAITNQFVQL